MLFSPSTIFFFFTLLLGAFLSISSTSWIMIWIGLELNLLSFIPLIVKEHNIYFSEAALKYFLVQAAASSIIIMAGSLQLINDSLSSLMLFFALIMKLGMAPFYFWLPQIMEGLSWPQIVIIMFLQKIAPLYLISYLNYNLYINYAIMFSSILSAIMGSINGYNILSLRKIMAFSSINHMAWMLMSIYLNEILWIIYFIFYVVISLSIILFFNHYQIYYLNDLSNMKNSSMYFYLLMSFCFLSLGGLPPFAGFFPKWFIVQMLIYNNSYIILSILLVSALITLFFYIRITIFILMLSNPSIVFNKQLLTKSNLSIFFSLIVTLNLLLMFTPMLFAFS